MENIFPENGFVITEKGLFTKRDFEKEINSENYFLNTINELSTDILEVRSIKDNKIIFCNKDLFETLGYTAGQAKSMSIDQKNMLRHPDDITLSEAKMKAVAESKGNEIIEWETKVYNIFESHWEYFLCKARVFKRDAGGKVEEILIISTNITSKCLELEKIRKSEEDFKNMIKLFPDTIQLIDIINHKVLYANRDLYQELGYTPEEISLKTTQELDELYHPDDYTSYVKFMHTLIHSPDRAVVEMCVRMRTRSGNYVWIRSRGKIFRRNAEQTPIEIMTISQNVTEKKLQEIELKRKVKELEEMPVVM